ncbi:MAG: DUF58 domain-containing protein [Myxococcales bacterium]|nr:MAG: DUF58 domain-containing protein [Myxococcales bacterium]
MIPKELIKKLRKIEIHTSRLANEQLAGSYQSVFKGRGMAFSEVRQYQHGDDVRFIDWNVSARMNDVYVKLFTEEREMTVMLLVDLSASQRYGVKDRSKIEVAAEIAALMAFSAIKNNDRVGLILFTDTVERFVPPKKGRAHVMRVVTEILNAQPTSSGTKLSDALDFFGSVSKRRSVAFLISDFKDHDYERSLRVVARRHDIIPVQIDDPTEYELPSTGLCLAQDLESGELLELDLSSKVVRNAFHRHEAKIRLMRDQLFSKLSLDTVKVRTDQPYIKPIAALFRRRQKRMRGAA